jgi:hydroxymethylpyrimidine kinase/phosphomethylpyrimidine kinase
MNKNMTKERKTLPAVLTIAGSDSSGGAGIQADLKTMAAYGVYGMSVITAITAQNTCGVRGVEPVSGEMIRSQLVAVMEDIFPAAVKIGMLSTWEAVEAVADCLVQYRPPHVVLDPVMVSTSGKSLLEKEAILCMEERLFPVVDLVTPNIPEMEKILQGKEPADTKPIETDQTKTEPADFIRIQSRSDMEKAVIRFRQKFGCDVLLKGGHMTETADDLLYTGEAVWYPSARIETDNTHGTGCTLSSGIACGLAKGKSLSTAVGEAKEYVRGAMAAGLQMGKGNGPLHHGWREK